MVSGVTYLDGQSQFYQVWIATGHGTVVAWIPDEFAMNLTENWNFVVGAGAPSIVNLGWSGLTSEGNRPTNQYLTAQIWSGSSPLRFSLPLHFVARRDSVTEVIDPIKILLKAALPVASAGAGNLLIPPGPGISGVATGALNSAIDFINSRLGTGFGHLNPNNNPEAFAISLWLGNYLRVPDLFIENIDVSFKGKLDPVGNPMEGQAVVRFCTLYAPVAQDIDVFLGDGLGAGGGAFAPINPTAPSLNP